MRNSMIRAVAGAATPLALATAVMVGPSASAQEQGRVQRTQIEEVVVTAQRRAESHQSNRQESRGVFGGGK